VMALGRPLGKFDVRCYGIRCALLRIIDREFVTQSFKIRENSRLFDII